MTKVEKWRSKIERPGGYMIKGLLDSLTKEKEKDSVVHMESKSNKN